MIVYAFNSTQNPKVYGFTADASGANLPDDQAPWIPVKSMEMLPGEPSRIGLDAHAVLMGIADNGYYVTAAEINISEA